MSNFHTRAVHLAQNPHIRYTAVIQAEPTERAMATPEHVNYPFSVNRRTLKSPLQLTEQCLLDIAIGADAPHIIASRYGLDELDLEVMMQNPTIVKAVEVRQAELAQKGEFFRLKARALAEDLLEKVYSDAKTTQDPKTRLDAVKFLSMAGGIDKPAEVRQVGSGRQVNIRIDLGAASGPVDVRVQFSDVFGDAEVVNADLAYDGECEEIDE